LGTFFPVLVLCTKKNQATLTITLTPGTWLLREELGSVLVVELAVVHAVHDGHQPLEARHRLLLRAFAQEILKKITISITADIGEML
jgi:hypothetical protein